MNASLEGAVLIPLGILFCFSLPLWYNILSFSVVIPAALFGGLIANMIFSDKCDDDVLEPKLDYEDENEPNRYK